MPTSAPHTTWRHLFAAVAVAAPLVAGCGDDDSGDTSGAATESVTTTPSDRGGTSSGDSEVVGVTDDTVLISVTGPFSSAIGALADKGFTNGVEVWAKEVNEAGGIHGRMIELVKVDNQNTPEGAIAACEEVKSNGSFMVIGLVQLPAENDCYDEAGIPVVDRLAAELDPDWTYVLAEFHQPAIAGPIVSFVQSDEVGGAGQPVGIVYTGDQAQNVAEFEAIATELDAQGVELAHSEKVATGQASYVAEMTRMRDNGAEVVIMSLVTESPGVLRDAASIGYEPIWVADNLGASTDVLCMAAGRLCEDVFGLRLTTGTNDDAHAAYVEKVRSLQGDDAAGTADTIDSGIYATADHVGAVLEAAGEDLTRDTFLEAARSMEPYDNGLEGPFTFADADVGIEALFPLRCCNPDGTFEVLGPAAAQF
jgi:branched-chain amino acid transport system substrate-binding protein